MGIRLYVGDDLERLAERLAGLLRKHRPGDPFSGQRVVVPSLGMRHWLARRLADKSGICANIEFVFPADFIRHCVSISKSTARYEGESMTWRLLGLLGKTSLKEPARYVAEDPTQVKAFGLAKRLAKLFDHYLLYRPEFFESWPAKTDHPDAPWQQELWREICDDTQEPHPAKARAAFLESLKPAGEEPVILFGMGNLPPEYLKILQALATVQEVHLLVTQPTEEIWDDLLSVRDQWRQHKSTGSLLPKSPNGHPLLVSLGRTGQEFHQQLLTIAEEGEWDETFFRKKTGGTLLAELQADLCRVDLPPREGRKAPVDDSLQVHSCHSPLREVEVLHDQLLHLFQARTDLAPHEVVVMTPDIEAYAPLIRAVFDNPESQHLKIPYTIADRHPRASGAEVNAFLSLLEMGNTRMPVNEVLTRLETPAVRRRFGIGEEELELLYPRCQDANVNWGYDAAHRAELLNNENGEMEEQNTWRFGLDRMILGYAMQADGEKTCEGRLPLAGVEGDVATAVGGLEDFVDALHELARDLQKKRSLPDWVRTLRKILNRFFDSHDEEREKLREVEKAIDRLEQLAEESGFAGEAHVDVVRAQLLATLEEPKTRDGYLRGSVTCCALKPLRSVPFRVICLLGMNDGAFPRADYVDAFNLMASHRRLGDRSVRDDDRYLFLETLLAAQEVLYLSYLGQSQSDEHEYPPSVVLGELLDALDRSFEFETDARAALVCKHRLQAFSQTYFDGNLKKFTSYSAVNAAAATTVRALGSAPIGESEAARWFVTKPLEEKEKLAKVVTLEALLNFFRRPVDHFVKNRMELYLRSREDLLSDEEPFALEGLEAFKVSDALLKLALDEEVDLKTETESMRARFQAEGRLPHGPSGRASFDHLRQNIADFCRALREQSSGPMIPQAGKAEKVDLRIEDFHLTGQLDSFADDHTQVNLLCAGVGGRELLAGWIRHVVWHTLPNPELSPQFTIVAGQKKGDLIAQWFNPIGDTKKANELLAGLLELFWRGRCEPLLLFPKSSYAYITASPKNLESEEAVRTKRIENARAWWEGDEFDDSFSERDEPAHHLCFRNADPLADPRFGQLAEQVFGNLLNFKHSGRVTKAMITQRQAS